MYLKVPLNSFSLWALVPSLQDIFESHLVPMSTPTRPLSDVLSIAFYDALRVGLEQMRRILWPLILLLFSLCQLKNKTT